MRVQFDPLQGASGGDIAVAGFRKLGLGGPSWAIFPPKAAPVRGRPGRAMAYHLLSTSMEEAVHRPSADEAFASAVRHALDGYVDMAHYRRIGQVANDRRMLSESRLIASIEGAAANDLNPVGRCFLGATSLNGVLAMHSSIHRLTGRTVKTEFAIQDGTMVMMRRFDEAAPGRPLPDEDAALAAIDIVVSRLPARSAAAPAAPARLAGHKVSDIAERLGLRLTAANDIAMAFESDLGLQVNAVARLLGCQPRTLQRELRSAGITANHIRRAAMLNAATTLLPSGLTLTEIAHQTAYADQAHMTRAFVSACGLPPSELRKAFT